MLPSQVWSPPLPPLAADGLARPRIGIGGIGIESSTFSAHRTDLDDFRRLRGAELLAFYPFTRSYEADWVPILRARALPGGVVRREAYESLRDEICEGAARLGPFDGFYLDLHGAMSVEQMVDAEAALAEDLRAVLGPDTLVTTPMDLHGNVSRRLLAAVDLLTCYRMAPHEDEPNTRERAAWTLLSRLRGPGGADPHRRRPLLAWVPIPVLLPGEKTSTRIEPAAGLYRQVAEAAQRPGVLDAALWVGYAWADEPRCHAAVVVSGDDRNAITEEAARIAAAYWDARAKFRFVAEALPLPEALNTALAHLRERSERPYVISDSGDNPTAGGSGDVTWTLARLLEVPELSAGSLTAVYASVNDPVAVPALAAAGVGADVDLLVGARVDDVHAPPVRLRGTVTALDRREPGGLAAAVRVGGITVLLTERRCPFHTVADFSRLQADPREADLLVVKIGYLEPELFELAHGWTLALTPGGVDQDLLRLGHRHLRPGTYPFEPEAARPDFTPVVTGGGSSDARGE